MVRSCRPRPRPQTHSAAYLGALRSLGRMKLCPSLLRLSVITSIMLPASGIATENTKPPDAIFVNRNIYTQAKPARVEALAIGEGRIIAIGSNDDIEKLKGSRTQV